MFAIEFRPYIDMILSLRLDSPKTDSSVQATILV